MQRMGSQVPPVTDGELLFGGVRSWELAAHHKGGQSGLLCPEKALKQRNADGGL